MTLYAILFFIALLIGMAVSVYAFGTGSKRAKIFKEIYYSIEEVDGIGVIYTKTSEYSATLRFKNPCQKYCANIDGYYEYAHLMTALAQTLGEGYAMHKQDVFTRKGFSEDDGQQREFLSDAYFRYFNGTSPSWKNAYTISATPRFISGRAAISSTLAAFIASMVLNSLIKAFRRTGPTPSISSRMECTCSLLRRDR